jgi:hypothetical protein
MASNLATVDDFDRGIRSEELSAHSWQVPTTSIPFEEYDHLNLPWQIQHVIDNPYRAPVVVKVRGAIHSWIPQTIDRLTQLSRLQQNWDSYGAFPVSPQAIALAIQVMSNVMTDRTPMPTIVPTTDRGIQLEWHLAGIDMEVEIRSDGILSVLYEDAVNQETWEGDLVFIPSLILRELKGRVQVITERTA